MKLYRLLRHLPPESATVAELTGIPTGDRWGATEHLLATAVDQLNLILWQNNGKKGAKKPRPIRRPDSNRPRPELPDFEELDRQLALPRRELPTE